MSNPNIGWLFYKELYRKGNDSAHIQSKLEEIKKVSSVDTDKLKFGEYGFILKTTYPGLIIGSGYIHGVSSDDDVKIGFYFDHTTGLPQLPGSSVKGVLRSFFKSLQNPDKEELALDFFKEVFKEIGYTKEINKEFLGALEDEIFEGIDSKTKKPLPVYNRDKFFDAVVIEISNDGLLSEDYITPHKEPLKNPVPIKILKVSGGVSFKFQFDLKDGSITVSEKELLFLKLLLFSGVGAKTNVGYGQFEEWSDEEFEKLNQKYKRDILKTVDSELEKLKIKLEKGIITNPKSIHDAIKKIESLSKIEKSTLKKFVDEIITVKEGKWYKKIEKLL